MFAAFTFGLVPYFARELSAAGIAAPAIAFFRYVLTAVALCPFLALARGQLTTTLWGIAAGASMGVGWVGYVKALETVPVATAGVLYMTYPIFTLLVSWLWFGNRPVPRAMLAGALVFGAAVVAMLPGMDGLRLDPALILALAAPCSFGISINILTEKLVKIAPIARIACVTLGSVIGLLPLVLPLEARQVFPSDAGHWWLILGLAIATALVPQLLYTVCAPRIGAVKSAVAGSIELPTMFFVGWLAFAEAVTPVHMLAGGMVLAAILLTPARRPAGLTVSLAAARGPRPADRKKP